MYSKIIKDKTAGKQLNLQHETSKTTINQFNFLQNTLGNQKVQELVSTGVISPHSETPDQVAVQVRKQKEKEAEQILADRKALTREIDKSISQKMTALDALKIKNPGKDIYVNVTTELHFVKMPGDNPHDFYHYTDLVDADFSLKNINKTGEPDIVNRGYTIRVTDSYLYKEEAIADNQEEDVTEEISEEEEMAENATEVAELSKTRGKAE